MDRRPYIGDPYGNSDENRTNPFHLPLGVNNIPSGNVQFLDGLIPGLENLSPITLAGATGTQSYGISSWNSGIDVNPLSSVNYGSWTSYPTDDNSAPFLVDGSNGAAGSPTFLSADDYFRSLSQPDSTSSTETGLFTTRSRSHSEHFDVLGGTNGVNFSSLAQTGQDLYTEALGQWNNHSSAPQTRAYDPFGTSHLLHQDIPIPQVQSDPEVRIPNDKPSGRPVLTQPHSVDSKLDTKIKNKPSYSEVTKNKPSDKTGVLKRESQGLQNQPKPEGFPDFTGIKPHAVYHNRPRSSKSFRGRKRIVLEPTTIKPNSRYGLDTFEEPVVTKSNLSDHLSASSGSNPQSRKGSTSSGAGSYCAADELDSLNHIKHSDSMEGDAAVSSMPWTETSYESEDFIAGAASAQKDCLYTAKATVKGEDCKRKTQGEYVEGLETKRARSSSCNNNQKAQEKTATTKEKPFFDPTRIFGGRPKMPPPKPPQTTNNTQNCIPNNQQTPTSSQQSQGSKRSPEPGNILNNDKPKAKLNSNINRSCYINNNLRESSASAKKQTNADAQRDSSTGRAPAGSPSSDAHTRSSQGGRSSSQSRHRANSGSSRSPSHEESPTPPRRKNADKRPQPQDWDQQYVIGDLILQLWQWALWATQEAGYAFWNIFNLAASIGLALDKIVAPCLSTEYGFISTLFLPYPIRPLASWDMAGRGVLMFAQHGLSAVKSLWIILQAKIYRKSASFSEDTKDSPSKKFRACGLKENITLPSTGDEAMKRLLAGKGKDPYSILGVRSDVADDVIKKYYRRQAVLVHPDKNQIPGAEEAFKILGHAFDLIGDPEKRRLYDTQHLEAQEEEDALHQFADLLSKLHEKMAEAANLMRCENCGGKHRRVSTDRPMYAARYCQRCDYNHPVREGDVWAESHMLGFLWNYFACMDNRVYDITEWASCQCDRFKHIQANAHHVVYRIATNANSGTSRHSRQHASRSNEADLEDFLSHLFHQQQATGSSPGPGGNDPNGAFARYGHSQPTSQSTWNPGATSNSKKGRRKKKRH